MNEIYHDYHAVELLTNECEEMLAVFMQYYWGALRASTKIFHNHTMIAKN